MIQITEASRELDSADATFIVDTWLRSYRVACNGGSRTLPPQDMAQYLIRNMPEQRYFELLRPHVYTLLQDPDNVILLASMEEDRDLYVGWICGRKTAGPLPAVLHYVYVKRRHRREGVCYKLMSELLTNPTSKGLYTCQTWEWFQVILDRSNTWAYRPKLAMKGAAQHAQQTTAQTAT